jgi:hypothetical protein
MTTDQYLPPRDLRTRLLARAGKLPFDAACALESCVDLVELILEHAGSPPGPTVPTLQECVEMARECLRQIQGEP